GGQASVELNLGSLDNRQVIDREIGQHGWCGDLQTDCLKVGEQRLPTRLFAPVQFGAQDFKIVVVGRVNQFNAVVTGSDPQ
ncbi:MAG TPA: hypothetical protein DCF45_03975, partial [Gammaproteobacteria bacterium]|nr:hypothetical protein [Gammaproteobacteria bacterium]